MPPKANLKPSPNDLPEEIKELFKEALESKTDASV